MGVTISKGENQLCCFRGHTVYSPAGIYTVPVKMQGVGFEGGRVRALWLLTGGLPRRIKFKREAKIFLVNFILLLKQGSNVDSSEEAPIMCNA